MPESMPYSRVAPPDLSRPRPHGLLSVATVTDGLDIGDVLDGIVYPVDCGSEYTVTPGNCGPIGPYNNTDTLGTYYRDPFTLTTVDQCRLTWTVQQQRARVRAKLARLEATATAQQLASSPDMRQSFVNQTDVELLAGTPVPIDCALGLIDAWGAERGLPTVAYAPIEASQQLDERGVTDQGGVLTSIGGTRIALMPFVGQQAPTGAGIDAPWWLWATGPVRVFRSEVVPGYDSYPATNEYIARASRAVIVDWACAIAAVPVTDFCAA